MVAQYSINLSSGSALATLYPLETNGPDNTSTARLVVQARPSFDIVTVTPGTDTVSIVGDLTDIFRVGQTFEIEGSTGNDGTFTVQSSTFLAGNTQIVTVEDITDATPDGVIIVHIFRLHGDLAYRFVNAFSFTVQNSAEIDDTYVVTALGSVFDGSTTIIPVAHGDIRDNLVGNIAPPLGSIIYVNPDNRTSLKLPGKGVMNYGEMLIENLVHMLEHFAGTSAPELNTNIGTAPAAQALTGQLWYNTTAGEQGFRYYNGSAWTNQFDFDNGALIFRDSENSNNDIYVTGSETNLPAPWAGGGNNQAGLVIWAQTNPASGSAIFRVLSSDGAERLRVEHDGAVEMTNNLQVSGTTVAAEFIGPALSAATPTYTFITALDTGMYLGGSGEVIISVDGDGMFAVNPSGVISVLTAAYETLISSDNDIPNKKYVDDAVGGGGSPGSLFDKITATAGQTVFNTTNAGTLTETGDTIFQLVYRNGVLQNEGVSNDFQVTGANQITFNAGLALNDIVIVIEL